MRDFLTDDRWKVEEADIVIRALHMIYDYETGGLEEARTDSQHRYRGMIRSTTQIHLE